MIVVIGAFISFVVFCLLPLCRVCLILIHRVRHSNKRYIHHGAKQPIELGRSMFTPGTYQTYYFQYGSHHGPFSMTLGFRPQDGYIVDGGGTDDIGTYVITGIYSLETLRMGLIKQYQVGTGNPTENLGHQVTIQVEWNSENEQFEGKYYLRTSRHRDSNKFVIRHDNEEPL